MPPVRDAVPRGGWVPAFEAATKRVVRLESRRWRVGPPAGRERAPADCAFPRPGRTSVAEVTSGDVPAVPTPVWQTGPATGRRVRPRAGAVMRRAVARDHWNANPLERRAEVFQMWSNQVTRRQAVGGVGGSLMPLWFAGEPTPR